MARISTPWGTAEKFGGETEVRATPAQLRAWAQRTGAAWPCSDLARLGHSIYARFAKNGDLVDLHSAARDVSGDEFIAWASDVLREALGPDHPAIRS
jgi:hypothetical protein